MYLSMSCSFKGLGQQKSMYFSCNYGSRINNLIWKWGLVIVLFPFQKIINYAYDEETCLNIQHKTSTILYYDVKIN